jgi:hypothetical protein
MAEWSVHSEDGREVRVEVLAADDGTPRVALDIPALEQLRFDVRGAEQLRAALGAAIGHAQVER